MNLQTYAPVGDKENSPFFEEYLTKIYERRQETGLDEIVGDMRGVVVQVEHGDAVRYLAELAAMGPYRLRHRATDRHPQGVRPAVAPRVPAPDRARAAERGLRGRAHALEQALPARRAQAQRPLHRRGLRARRPSTAVREALEPQNIRFVYDGDSPNGSTRAST